MSKRLQPLLDDREMADIRILASHERLSFDADFDRWPGLERLYRI